MRRFGYAYASTSYGSQGATYNRVLIHAMDFTAEQRTKQMLSARWHTVAMTRPQEELQCSPMTETKAGGGYWGIRKSRTMGLSPEQVQDTQQNQISI